MKAKKRVLIVLITLLALVLCFVVVICSIHNASRNTSTSANADSIYPNLVGEAMNYSDTDNWMVKQDDGNEKVDVFYLYPTCADPKCLSWVSEVSDYMKTHAADCYERGASCFDDYTNVYAPYYRQLPALTLIGTGDAEGLVKAVYESEVRTDVYAALDYYFEHYNNGKPFILASHSQGSAAMQNVLAEYMSLHADYYSRMIAAYTVGMMYSGDYLAKNSHVKIAQGETDTGVVITWNTEAAGATMDSLPVSGDSKACINPLNWKTDDTYAGIEENKGSYSIDKHAVIEGVADAQIDTNRMVVVTTTAEKNGYKKIPVFLIMFGDQSYHFNDWDFFYENIKENGQKRIAAYFK